MARAKAGTKDTTKSAGARWRRRVVEIYCRRWQRRSKGRHGRSASPISPTRPRAQTSHAVAASKVGLERAAKIGRETVLPELERTGAKLRERTRPDRLKSDYREYLFRLHERVLDPSTEQLFFKPTQGSGRAQRA